MAIWPIERSVVPPILRTRSAISSVDAKMLGGLFVEQQMVVAEMRPADVPVEILGLEIERERIRQHAVERAGDVANGVGRQIGGRVQRELDTDFGLLLTACLAGFAADAPGEGAPAQSREPGRGSIMPRAAGSHPCVQGAEYP